MAYNPYNAAKQITDNKQKWANATAKGEDASAYESAAKQYYDELRGAGRDDVADKLQKSDAVQAQEYLRQLSPSYDATPSGLQGKSDDVYKVGKDYGADIAKSYDTVYNNNINVDPTQTGYGKSVMASYGAAADKAYSTALGSGANDNGGNVDSYAAANANRQKAAMLSQGHGDILNYYNAIAGRATDWAGGKASALSGNLAQLQANVDADRADRQAVEQTELQRYLGDLGYKSQLAGYESNERISADSNASNERINAANNDTQRYGYDVNERINAANNDTQRYVADKDYNGVVYKANSSASSANGGTDTAGSTDAQTQKGFASTITQIVSAALGQTDADGEPSSTAADAYIQQLLNDNSYTDAAKAELSDAYYERTGRRIRPQSAAAQAKAYGQKIPYAAILNDVALSGKDKQGKLARILSLYRSGVIDDDTASQLMTDVGINADEYME